MMQQTETAATLRRLLACPQCRLQFDVSELAVGSRFRCSCGQLMAVPRLKPHDADVVRCSSCGGPRRGASAECGFCGSDFTIHERDLHTLCPDCLTRISDRARYCHSCGVAIAPQMAAGCATDHRCPCCTARPALFGRPLDGSGIGVLECRGCGGTFIGHEQFGHLQQTALRREIAQLKPDGAQQPPQTGQIYRRCPLCDRQMSRRNFERRSGVIIDICPKDGLWLDQGELDRVLRWIRTGGLSRARAAEARREREQKLRFERPGNPLVQAGSIFHEEDSRPSAPGPDFLRGVLEFFS